MEIPVDILSFLTWRYPMSTSHNFLIGGWGLPVTASPVACPHGVRVAERVARAQELFAC